MNVETKRGSAQRRLASALTTLLLIFGTAGIITVSSAPPAAAISSSTITPQYWWPHNGCNIVTDTPMPGVSFTYACNHHDGCYWGQWANRATCDWWFYNDMRNACWQQAQWWQRPSCLVTASGYYGAVRAMGEPYYGKQIASERINTPVG
ncbi:phospholipase A2 [Arthrobacter sp. ES1]|uniref:phospholipase A2 n=1 Tax=Arthrobacter sp. ES1 TaxID=1897056 RepID=UPI001D0012A7|nr:phospholipase A2 [Arthrobacter sp. ES1]